MARLKEKYREEIVPELMKEFGYSNVMEAPKLEKIVVNIGLGKRSAMPRHWKARSRTSRRSPGRGRL